MIRNRNTCHSLQKSKLFALIAVLGAVVGLVVVRSAPAVAGTNTLTLPASTDTLALQGDVIGLNQTWQNVTASRSIGTTYTNSTGKPIFVQINSNTTGTLHEFKTYVNSVQIGDNVTYANSSNTSISFIVPNGQTYLLSTVSGSPSFFVWAELR